MPWAFRGRLKEKVIAHERLLANGEAIKMEMNPHSHTHTPTDKLTDKERERETIGSQLMMNGHAIIIIIIIIWPLILNGTIGE